MAQVTIQEKVSLKAKVQKLGSTLSSMVMPNIGALIAWGVITALFIPDGYLPNEGFASIGSIMLKYLIPILIGYTGGKVIAGDRGAVVASIATMGVIAGTDITMIMGAMIMGPLSGFVIKKFDQYVQPKVKVGFEMLVNNFSSGLIGFALALLGYVAIGPVVNSLTTWMAQGVEVILNAHLIPLTNILIEPAKILFLNNAINHGILTPLGTEQVAEAGKSILFLLEANPGPGLGVLLAFTLFGKGSAKASAPGAIIIHFLGGIHEIYFPYVMMKPSLFLAVIGGGVSGSFVFQALGAGLRAPASPGSIIAILTMTAAGSYLAVILGILTATVVSFGIASIILKADAKEGIDDFEEKVQQTQAAKAVSKGLEPGLTAMTDFNTQGIQHIVFACDAGMGSSAMGASILKKMVQEAGLTQDVTNRAINNLEDNEYTLIVTQEELHERAKQKAPHATFVTVGNFLKAPEYADIITQLSGKKLQSTGDKQTKKLEESFLKEMDFTNITEILVVHDERTGSATMGTRVLTDVLTQAGVVLPIRKIDVREPAQSTQALIITIKDLEEQVKAAYPEAKMLVVESFVTTSKYEMMAHLLKNAS